MKHSLKSFIVALFLLFFLSGCDDEIKLRGKEYIIGESVVSPAWVNKLIEYHKPGSTSEAPLEYDYARDHKYLIFETSWGSLESSAKKYKAGHVPGAIHSDSDIYENGDPMWFLLPDGEIFSAMSSMGITADTTVVVYSNSPGFAARLWWILKYAGLSHVLYMDGGYEKWITDGYTGETTINTPTAASFTGQMNPDYIATVDYVFANYGNENVIIADVRGYDEYTGETSGYDYLIEKGRIPGAVWFHDVGGTNNNYYNDDTTLKTLDEIKIFWAEHGLTSVSDNAFNKEVIFYCGGGYRSSLAFLYAYMMGYTNVRNLSDGWEGWSTTYTYVGIDAECGPDDGQKHGAWDSAYCLKPSGRPVETGEAE